MVTKREVPYVSRPLGCYAVSTDKCR